MTQANTVVEHLGAEYFQDPYSVHARLRAERPVTRVVMPGSMPVWLVTGYAEARAALADPRLRKSMPDWHPDPDSIFAALDMHMLNSDPPDHGRLRRLVNKTGAGTRTGGRARRAGARFRGRAAEDARYVFRPGPNQP